MFRKIMLNTVLSSLLVSTVFAQSTIQERKEAFRQEFLASKIEGNIIANEFRKYNLHPSDYSMMFQSELTKQTTPTLIVKFNRDYDTLGRLQISPSFNFKPVSPEDFPVGAYINSLLNFQKDMVFNPVTSGSLVEIYEVRP